MSPNDENERKRLVVEGARKQLDTGTWPQVMGVFGYKNPNAPRTPDEEYDRLKCLFERALCPNMVQFIEWLRFAEAENHVTMSYNFSMSWRLTAEDKPTGTLNDARLLFGCPDVLVGTRSGVEGAAVWLRNFSQAMTMMAPEPLQVMDKIFGEAVALLLRESGRWVSVEDMFRSAVLGEKDALAPAEQPARH